MITTNSIIFTYVRRSTKRVQLKNGRSESIITVSPREGHLLKHMIFMFVVFFCGWAPIYIIKTFKGTTASFSLITEDVFTTIPAVAVLIDVGDLFLYNHELRKYFTDQRLLDQTSHLKERVTI